MQKAFDEIAQNSARANAQADGDYIGKDGLLVCGKCGEKKQAHIKTAIIDRVVFVACACKREEEQRMREAQKRMDAENRIKELRRRGITSAEGYRKTFANDNGSNPSFMETCKRYVESWEHVLENNIGLLIYGGVGTGKSFGACCIANALINKGVPAMVTSLPKLITAMRTDEAGETLKSIESAALVVIDDFGVERATSYGQECAFEVIDTRANSGKPLIITTNLALQDFRGGGIEVRRIYDRILGMCTPVRCDGDSRRLGQYAKRAAGILGTQESGK